VRNDHILIVDFVDCGVVSRIRCVAGRATEAEMNDEEQRTFLSDLNKAQTALMITLIALAFLALCGGFFFIMYLILKISGCL
jgi:hypothetical protein